LLTMSPEAQALVRAARRALRPKQGDRERVLRLLLPLVGVTQGAGLAHAASAATATIAKLSAVLIGVGMAGGGLFLASGSQPPVIKAALTAPVERASVSLPSLRLEPLPASPVHETPQPGLPRKPSRGAAHRSDSLVQEVEILSRAGAELHAGRAEAALAAFDEHQRNFPSAVLAQERLAGRVRALCALGRLTEARIELERLARTSPNSPHEARARKTCRFGETPEQ
jgi:hypothetical protein